jgi:hypothetical protein
MTHRAHCADNTSHFAHYHGGDRFYGPNGYLCDGQPLVGLISVSPDTLVQLLSRRYDHARQEPTGDGEARAIELEHLAVRLAQLCSPEWPPAQHEFVKQVLGEHGPILHMTAQFLDA